MPHTSRRGVLAAAVGALSGCISVNVNTPAVKASGGNTRRATTTAPQATAGDQQTHRPTETPIDTVTAQIIVEPRDADAIEDAIVRVVNQRRETALNHSGSKVQTLNRIAQNHSDAMAERRAVGPTIGPTRLKTRLEDNGFECAIKNPGDTIGTVDLTEVYAVGAVNMRGLDPAGVARKMVAKWWTDPQAVRTLTLPDAERIGVGVALNDALAYCTAIVCN